MLFATFAQLPMKNLGRIFSRPRFLGALLLSNFVVIPLLVWALMHFLPPDPMIRLGLLFVLLTPCVDYVITFSHIGRADAGLLLASTPVLLVVQMLLLPVYLGLFLGDSAAALVQPQLFLQAFVWLIVLPLLLAALLQFWEKRGDTGRYVREQVGLVAVPVTALVLFIVATTIVPRLEAALPAAERVLPFYILFAIMAPLTGWRVARLFRLRAPAARAVSFSAATRNSLVVLPIALAVPGAIPVLPAVILTQTMVELLASLVYMRLMPRLGASITH